MSFGFSISDFLYCGQLAYQLYTEFKEAAGDCQAFAKELLLLHQVILKTEALIGRGNHVLDGADQFTLGIYLEMCNDILFIQIAGVDDSPFNGTMSRGTMGYRRRLVLSRTGNPNFGYGEPSFNGHDRTLRDWLRSIRQKFEERSFAKQIPKIRGAISTVTEKLTLFQVLTIRSLQIDERDILEGLHELQTRTYQYLENGHDCVESATERLEKGQARMEAQITALLDSQQRDHGSAKSYSLDASSPEGRKTWMDLGRLLRAEGITPAMIEENRELLVRAMKTSLEEGVSPAQSYRTAPQSFEDDYDSMSIAQSPQSMAGRSASASISLLGSAPVLGATFSKAFLERHNGAARSLDREQNVQDGMESLLKGMDTEEQADVETDEGGDGIDVEHM